MQIFLSYASPYLTAKILDKRRLHKQIIEVLKHMENHMKIGII